MTPDPTIDPAAYLRSISVPFNLPRVTDPVILNALEAAGHIKVLDDKGSVDDLSGPGQTRVTLGHQRFLISYQSMAFTKRVFLLNKATPTPSAP